MGLFIVTFTPYYKKSVIRELASVDKSINVERVFSDGIIMIQSEKDQEQFLAELLKSDPIFIKHIMPVMTSGKIKRDLESDKQILLEAADRTNTLSRGDKFAVQCRVVSGGLDYSSKDIEVFIGQNFFKKGAIPSFSDKELRNEDISIVSILINNDDYFIGFSSSRENLNYHCDEYRICSKESREISRAENKLKEALVKFDISLDGNGIALDIGAAPGGWTKVLVDYGFNVVAVDPGDLHPDLQAHPKVKHYKCRIEQLSFENYFDLIVNDMNVDPSVTAEIMNSLAPTLRDGGICIVTVKLPNNPEKGVKQAQDVFRAEYEVLGTKSLFHNRQEVTCLLKKRNI